LSFTFAFTPPETATFRMPVFRTQNSTTFFVTSSRTNWYAAATSRFEKLCASARVNQ
jgi:hypothetical protein